MPFSDSSSPLRGSVYVLIESYNKIGSQIQPIVPIVTEVLFARIADIRLGMAATTSIV